MGMAQQALQFFRRSKSLPQVELRRAQHSLACYHPHSHDEWSVGVVDAGAALCCLGSQQQLLMAGAVVVIPPGIPHSCNPVAELAWSYRMLFVEAGWVARLLAQSATKRVGIAPSGPVTADAYAQFDLLFSALERDEDASELAAQLSEFVLRHVGTQALEPAQSPAPLRALHRARDLILKQLEDKLSLHGLAQAAGLSPFHLIRSFKQAYGLTPHAFQLDQRINRAKRLLKQGQGIASVAQQLGFADQSHFQRHFKLRHAVTPLRYQDALVAAPGRVTRRNK